LTIRLALCFSGHVLVGDGTQTKGEKWLGFILEPTCEVGEEVLGYTCWSVTEHRPKEKHGLACS